jgi:uncharacterized membrane protein YhaH (DUF805 family)
MRYDDSEKMDYYQWLLASTEGRLRRSTYWGASLSLLLIAGVLVLLSAILGQSGYRGWQSFVVILTFAIYCFSGICLTIKRFHDRDMSGWWILVGFIPYIGGLFTFVVAGCLAGTVGSNSYGPDPKADETIANNPGQSERSQPGEDVSPNSSNVI